MKNHYKRSHVRTLYKHVNICVRVLQFIRKWIRFWMIVLDMKYMDGESPTTRLKRGSTRD
jgi:hypothetical protein